MDDTFSFRAGRMPRRRIDPLALKAAVTSACVIALTGVFAKIVIDSEVRSFTRAEAKMATTDAGGDQVLPTAAPDPEIDTPARTAVQTALTAALDMLARGRAPSQVSATALSGLETGLIFVDGPSTSDRIVSLATSGDLWAAAVLGESGTCFYAKVTSEGVQTFGTGRACTGEDALEAAGLPSWDV